MQVWISKSPDQRLADFSASLIRTDSFVMGKFNGKNFLVTEYFYEKYKIWGATAMIILLLKNLLKN